MKNRKVCALVRPLCAYAIAQACMKSRLAAPLHDVSPFAKIAVALRNEFGCPASILQFSFLPSEFRKLVVDF